MTIVALLLPLRGWQDGSGTGGRYRAAGDGCPDPARPASGSVSHLALLRSGGAASVRSLSRRRHFCFLLHHHLLRHSSPHHRTGCSTRFEQVPLGRKVTFRRLTAAKHINRSLPIVPEETDRSKTMEILLSNL